MIKCKICNKEFKSLQTHVKIHDISPKKYKLLYGDLFSKETLEKNRNAVKKSWIGLSQEEKSNRGKKSAKTRNQNNSNKGGRKPGFKQTEEFKINQKKLMLENNPFKNCKHTEESKEKMRGSRDNIKGDNNPFKKKYDNDKVFAQQFRETHKELWKSRDVNWRKHFSEKLSKSMAETDKLTNNHKNHIAHHWLTDKCINGGYLRSSWEIFFANHLENNNLIKSYSIEPISIQYYDYIKEMYRYTRVDFMIYFNSGEQALVEIKATWDMNLCYDKIKGIECYCLENNLQFLILNEKVLNENELFEFIKELNNGKCYLTRFIQRGFETPLCCSS